MAAEERSTIEACAADECGSSLADWPTVMFRGRLDFDLGELLKPGAVIPIAAAEVLTVRNRIPLWSLPA